uniref:Uncharacterized protein n=2 Tax=Vibrio TaxID=662 RepID=A0A0H3ZJQ6_9VIBR|nr:hypothetical protein [Vibrio tasmaniensis]AKN40847.1 hypothetical protein [Vibrio sp. 1F_189]
MLIKSRLRRPVSDLINRILPWQVKPQNKTKGAEKALQRRIEATPKLDRAYF